MAHHPKVSLSAECTPTYNVDEDLALWKELDIDYVGLLAPKIAPADWESTAQKVKAAGLRVNNIGGELHELMPILDLAAAVESEIVWTVSGPLDGLSWEKAADRFCETIGPAAARAKELGVLLAVEPTNSFRVEGSFIFNMRDAFDLARAAGVGVVLDFVMCWFERGLEDLVRNNLDLLTLVQVDDWKIGTHDTPNRVVIGDGDIPLEPLIKMLLDAGYEGAFDIELIGPKIEEEGYRSALGRSLDRTSELLVKLGA